MQTHELQTTSINNIEHFTMKRLSEISKLVILMYSISRTVYAYLVYWLKSSMTLKCSINFVITRVPIYFFIVM